MIMLLAQLTFTNSHELEHKKKFYFFISVSISWVLPILIGGLAIITGDTNKYSDFCWIQNKIFLFIFIALIFICYSILDVVNIKYTVANHWWGRVAIVNIITSPLFLIVFILSEDGKMKLIKDMLCCKKEENSNDIEIRLSESSTQ